MFLSVFLFLVNFIRTLFIIALIYFGMRLIVRFLFPFLLQKGMKNMQEKANNRQKEQQPKRPEGEVTIETQSHLQKQKQANNEEYVDFEEVD